MSAIAYESLMSTIEPLIREGFTITVEKANEPEYEGYLVYLVSVYRNGVLVTSADSSELTEAMAEVYMSTPEAKSK